MCLLQAIPFKNNVFEKIDFHFLHNSEFWVVETAFEEINEKQRKAHTSFTMHILGGLKKYPLCKLKSLHLEKNACNTLGKSQWVLGRLFNPSYWDNGIRGWLEDWSTSKRLLVSLWRPHLAQEQSKNPFEHLRVMVGPGGNVLVMYGPLSDQIPTLLSSTLQWY